jgi:small-conductance mechanosensitive channel
MLADTGGRNTVWQDSARTACHPGLRGGTTPAAIGGAAIGGGGDIIESVEGTQIPSTSLLHGLNGRRARTTAALPILIVLGLSLAPAPLWGQPAQPVETARARERATPVAPATLVIWNRPIVVFRVPIRHVMPAERAAAAARRFEALPADVRADQVRAEPAAVGDLRGVVVVARNQLLFGILDEDVDPTAGETLAEVSGRAVTQLRAVVEARAEQRRLTVVLRGLGLSLGAAAILALILWGIRRTADRVLLRLAEATHRRAVSLVGLDLRRPLEALERGLVRLTAWGLGLVAAYLWLAFTLYEFPYTRPWSERLRAELFNLLKELALGAVQAIPGLFTVMVIFLATRFIVRLVDALFQGVEAGAVRFRAFQPDTARASRRITHVLLWIFAFTIAYEYIPGSETDAFKAIGVLVGLMISLGSAGLVNQLMSGLVVIYSRALRPGELVRAGDLMGRVSEVGLLTTKLVSKGEEITIPNAVLVGTTVTNYSRLGGEDGPVISTSVTIGYDAPWRQVHAMLQLAAERTRGIRRQPRPYVLQKALSDFFVEYELRAHLELSAERAAVLSELHTQIQDAFNEFGVQIMSPAFESQPERPVVVPKARWFTAPAAPPKDSTPAKEAP